MIERLINLERPYGEPEYSKLSERRTQLKQRLSSQLTQEGQNLLEQLTDIFMRQETATLHDAFADGFCTAVELILEFERRKTNRK